MKKSRKWLIIYLYLLGLQACGISVLDVELPTGAPKLVVEGTLTNQGETQSVILSWSTSINNSNLNYINDAVVIISGTNGAQDTLQNTADGKYETQLEGVPGHTYQLDILLEGGHYQAFSTMPKPARADSVSVNFHEESMLREEGYYISLHTLNAPEEDVYYRWLIWKNGSLHSTKGIPGYFATLDLNNGQNWLSLQYPAPFKAGDTLKVQTIKMDKNVFRYYQGLYELMINDGGLMGPVPVNPETNISGNALGVFQAISIIEKEIIIQ